MKQLPPIFVINRAIDTQRKAAAEQNYQACDITPQFLEAVDGHGDLTYLAPYLEYLAEHFWGQTEIKPGAFACFMSHRNAWQRIVDQDLPYAIIAEDDSKPETDLHSKWDASYQAFANFDLVFLNNRMSTWVETDDDFQETNQAINYRLNQKDIRDHNYRAPGADGYFLTRKGAQILLDVSQEERVFCGVDWFMLACAWDSKDVKHSHVKSISELKKIWKHRGPKPCMINAMIARDPWFTIDKTQNSSINHSQRVDIESFRQKINA